VSHAADAKEIRLTTEVDEGCCATSGDPGRLQQVLWNLLSNAIKFTPRGGTVTVAARRVGPQIAVSVSDSGKGIRPDFLPYVFDRFRQADASTTRQHGGLGLGLSIVKHLVELHGGTVAATSEGEGRGATFTVTLPIAAALERSGSEATRTRSGRPAATHEPDGAPSLSGVRVLVVDDDPDARGLLNRVLSERGADVTTAGSASEAMELVEENRYHVIVSDIGMPGEDGYDFMRRARRSRHAATTPAVALTAFARAEDRQRALDAGYQAHVAKPVEPAELVAVVAGLARGK
jgi:CheY-like chemotaxis protein/anti-sigma regulatory factor (Ser/Thr protein kinase)